MRTATRSRAVLARNFLLLSSAAFGIGFAVGGLTFATLDRESRPRLTEAAFTLMQERSVAALGTATSDAAAPAGMAASAAPPVKTPDPGSREAAAALTPAAPAVPAPPPALPAVAAAANGESAARALEVQRGDTLLDLLHRAGIEAGEAHDAIGSLKEVMDPGRLQIGQRLQLELEAKAGGAGQRLARLVFPIDAAKEVHLVRSPEGGFAASSIERSLQRHKVRASGEIADSLYVSAQAAELPGEILGQMVKLLSWDVDFQRDLHPGDRFEAVYEQKVNEAGESAGAGELMFVGLGLRGRTIEAYRFTTGDGRTGFFDREGRALRKWLLKTPIDGARLSSRFGPRRHPVLGYTRMHKGIDFAAPPGTPILAAGDGTIEFVGWNRGYGRYVRLRHNGEYSTAYAHLSRFAPGMKRGRRIGQGEVIGYVGSTGLSTGPHLHYEVLYRDEQVNPLAIKAAFAADQIKADETERFLAQRAEIDRLRREPEQLVAERSD